MKMNTVIILILVVIGWGTVLRGGGEIGNAGKLRAPLMGIELEFSPEWSELGSDYLVSILSPDFERNPQDNAHYSLVRLHLENIKTVVDLRGYVEIRDQKRPWKAVAHRGVLGFAGALGDVQQGQRLDLEIYYLLKPCVVMQVSMNTSEVHAAEIRAIHHSLKWLEP